MWGKCFFAPGVGSEGASAARPARGGLAGAAATAGKGDRTAGGWPRRSRGMANGRGHGWGLLGRHGGRHCEGGRDGAAAWRTGLAARLGVPGRRLGERHRDGGTAMAALRGGRDEAAAWQTGLAARLGGAWVARRTALRRWLQGGGRDGAAAWQTERRHCWRVAATKPRHDKRGLRHGWGGPGRRLGERHRERALRGDRDEAAAWQTGWRHGERGGGTAGGCLGGG